MKVLIISSNSLPAAPSGPVYLAGAVRQAGHEVQIYERLFAADLQTELTARLKDFQPDVVGISIRLVFGDELDPNALLGTRHTDLRPRVKEIAEIVRQGSPARIVLGGPGFNNYFGNLPGPGSHNENRSAKNWRYSFHRNRCYAEFPEALPLFGRCR